MCLLPTFQSGTAFLQGLDGCHCFLFTFSEGKRRKTNKVEDGIESGPEGFRDLRKEDRGRERGGEYDRRIVD